MGRVVAVRFSPGQTPGLFKVACVHHLLRMPEMNFGRNPMQNG